MWAVAETEIRLHQRQAIGGGKEGAGGCDEAPEGVDICRTPALKKREHKISSETHSSHASNTASDSTAWPMQLPSPFIRDPYASCGGGAFSSEIAPVPPPPPRTHKESTFAALRRMRGGGWGEVGEGGGGGTRLRRNW